MQFDLQHGESGGSLVTRPVNPKPRRRPRRLHGATFQEPKPTPCGRSVTPPSPASPCPRAVREHQGLPIRHDEDGRTMSRKKGAYDENEVTSSGTCSMCSCFTLMSRQETWTVPDMWLFGGLSWSGEVRANPLSTRSFRNPNSRSLSSLSHPTL